MTVNDNYRKLLGSIKECARQSGRDPNGIQLVAVSKGHPLDRALSIYERGCRDFGESRVQEALEKIEEAPVEIRWHFIGTLQKNKVRKVIGKFYLIHSVDTFELAQKLSQVGSEVGATSAILLQANSSGEKSKQGLSPKEWEQVFPDLLSLPNLDIQGLMGMAPYVSDREVIRQTFAALRHLRDTLRNRFCVPLPHLSMGMTHDYPIAIEEGATLLRIGSAIFGERY